MDDAVGLINMNARLYDPLLGRFITPDSMMDGVAGQGLNRYSYVRNNPLSLTDPSGHRSLSRIIHNVLRGFVKYQVGSTVVATGFAIAGPVGALQGVAMVKNMNDAYNHGASTHDLFHYSARGIALMGFSKIAFVEAGDFLEAYQLAGSPIAVAATHAVVGGIVTRVGGGSFASGFYGAGFSALAGFAIHDTGDPVGDTLMRSLVGGFAAEIGGGKFGDGALTAAYAYLFSARSKITINGSATDKADFGQARAYLSDYPDASAAFDKADRAGLTVNIIHDGNDRAVYGGGVVYWDPRSALTTPDGLNQSPALGLYHEMVHAFGDPALPIAPMAGGYDNTEEYRVIHNYETPAARALGEGVRYDHRGDAYHVPCSVCR